MTVLVGVLAKDGAVVVADRAVTYGDGARLQTIADRMQKLEIVDGRMILAGTGQVGMGQRMANVVGQFSKQLHAGIPQTAQPRHNAPPCRAAIELHSQGAHADGVRVGVAIAQITLHDLSTTGAKSGQFGALAAYAAGGKPHLCEFGVADFQPEQRTSQSWYSSMGSGQILADPYLAFMRRTFWKGGQPNVEEAIFTAVWVIHHAIEAAPGFIAFPIDIAVLKKWDGSTYSAKMLTDDERDEHLEMVRQADDHLVQFRNPAAAPSPIPPTPPPPPRGA
jgi:20S proteasome alpha/beta subunit